MSVHNGPNIIESGLVLCLDAGDPRSYAGSGTAWTDRSGNGNNVDLFNSPTYSTANRGSLVFGSGWGRSASTTILNSSAYTKIAWFRPISGGSNNIISGGGESQHAFWMAGTTNSLHAGHNGNFSAIQFNPNPSGNMLNQWWYGAVTFNNTTGWAMYINGNQVITNNSTSTRTGNGIIRIAAYDDNGNKLNGNIAQALVYNRALSADEIKQNFEATRSRFGI